VKVAVARAADVAPGSVHCVVVRGVQVALLRTEAGTLHALRGVCPHQQAPLAEGRLEPMFAGDDIPDYHLDRSRFVLRCPWHAYEFDVETGRAPANPDRYRVRTYPVSVEDGSVLVEV
jgi:nitrite reductase/ring-hydroxylating ferredoxin subunit